MAHDRTNALNSDEISTYRTEKGIQVIPDEDAAGWNFYIHIYIMYIHSFKHTSIINVPAIFPDLITSFTSSIPCAHSVQAYSVVRVSGPVAIGLLLISTSIFQG